MDEKKRERREGREEVFLFARGRSTVLTVNKKLISRQGIQRFVVTFGLKSEKGKGAEGAP